MGIEEKIKEISEDKTRYGGSIHYSPVSDDACLVVVNGGNGKRSQHKREHGM